MSTSREYLVPHVIGLIREVKPNSILDVGTGHGLYGLACRQYFENARVDGIEIWKKNIKPWHKHIYDNIYHGDYNKFEFDTEYDVTIFCDVLEHMEKEDAIKAIVSRTGYKVISIPIGHLPQPPDENPWEAHISEWQWEDIKDFNIVKKIKGHAHILCLVSV